MAHNIAKNEDELDWEKIWETFHNSKVSYTIQSTIWSQLIGLISQTLITIRLNPLTGQTVNTVIK